MSSQPTVDVLVLNHNGREHLEACLASLEALTYPRDRFAITVVDNGSTDGSLDLVRERFPGARVIAHGRNLGFAGGYNAAIAACTAEFVALLNNDTHVDPGWLTELVSAADRQGAAAAASRILDWTGEHIDFTGGVLSVIGHTWQIDAGQPATNDCAEKEILFGCAGSMLVNRQVYLDTGGFDDSLFIYFEDVDFGWRMNLLGHRFVLAPRAVTYHRLHGTVKRWAFAQRLRLYERNALVMIYKNYEADSLARVLPVAVALSLARALAAAPLDPAAFGPGRTPPEFLPMSPTSVAPLLALEEFGTRLPELARRRAEIQRRRRRSDAELFPLFVDPLRMHTVDESYAELARSLVAEFGIDRLVGCGPAAGLAGRTPASPASAAAAPAAALDALSSNAALAGGASDAAEALPTISVVILTTVGPLHLGDCLQSLRAQSYPADRLEVIVVDNASAEDPTPAAEQACPGVKVIRNPTNVGFAEGNNVGVRAATGDYVFILNDDTRLDANCLQELMTVARRERAVGVAARILDWTGKRIDFAGASINFESKGFQVDFGQRNTGQVGAPHPMLFGCGAAVLFDRAVYLQTGGFDKDLFIYYEDLEIGWRMWLLGRQVWFAPAALVYHKHHGTTGKWPPPGRVRLYERNSLRTVFTHLEPGNLQRVLPAALILSVDRALLTARLGREKGLTPVAGLATSWQRLRMRTAPRTVVRRFRHALGLRGASKQLSVLENVRRVRLRGFLGAAKLTVRQTIFDTYANAARRAGYFLELGSQPPDFDLREEPFPAAAGAILLGLSEFLRSLPQLRARRAMLQSLRERTDREILAGFAEHWLSPTPAPRQVEHDELQATLVEAFGLAAVAGLPERSAEDILAARTKRT